MTKIVDYRNANRVLFEHDGDLVATITAASRAGTNLTGADLNGADLNRANLDGADLRGANLTGADLTGAGLYGAYIRGAYLCGASLAWQSHDLIAEILRRAAGDNIPRLKYAGLVLLRRDWCWEQHVKLADPELPWALGELARWIQPNDGHPECLSAYIEKRGEA